LVSLNVLTEAVIGELLHTPGIVARVALATALFPGWVGAWRNRSELMQYWKRISQNIQDDEELRGLVHDVRAFPALFWVALGLSAAVSLQAARDVGVAAVARLFQTQKRWPTAALCCVGGALATSVIPVPTPRAQGDDVVVEASNFVQRLADRFTPFVLAGCEMQPAAVASALAIAVRCCLSANSFVELSVSNLLQSNPFVARVALLTCVVPAWVARNHFKNANASPDDAAQNASRISSVFWLIALVSGFITVQSVKDMASHSTRKMLHGRL